MSGIWVKYAWGMQWLGWGCFYAKDILYFKNQHWWKIASQYMELLVKNKVLGYSFPQKHGNNSLNFNNLIQKSVMVGCLCVKHRKKNLFEVWCNFLAFNLVFRVFPIILTSQLGVFPWCSHRLYEEWENSCYQAAWESISYLATIGEWSTDVV